MISDTVQCNMCLFSNANYDDLFYIAPLNQTQTNEHEELFDIAYKFQLHASGVITQHRYAIRRSYR